MENCKTCTKCGVEKLLSGFHKDKEKKFGVRNTCKVCAKKISYKYYINNSESIRKKVSIYAKAYTPKFNREIDSRLKNLCTKAKGRTKEFNLVDLDLLDLWDKQDGRCAYTKLPLLATANQFNTVSLDRVDSSKGYVVGNIQLVCAAINKMKQEYTEEVFILFCLLVTQNNKLSESPESLLARYVPLGTVDK
jgi:hypothetical protein